MGLARPPIGSPAGVDIIRVTNINRVAAGLRLWPGAQAAMQFAAPVPRLVLVPVPHRWCATSRASARLSAAARSVTSSNAGLVGKETQDEFTIPAQIVTSHGQTPYRARV